MESSKGWERMLADMGMPAEIDTEEAKARAAGVELVPADADDEETLSLTKRLQEEDPRNVFGGFPNSMDGMLALVATFLAEAGDQGIKSRDVRIAVHSSCINDQDCVMLTHPGGKVYHYNTRDITDYSRGALAAKLKPYGVSLAEK